MPEKPSADDNSLIVNEKDRIFRTWASVEVRDSQGDLIPIEKFAENLPVFMKRGAPITIRHSNKIVGKCLNYVIKENPKYKKLGVLVDGMIFQDYLIDTEAWDGIKNKKYPGVSIGGDYKVHPDGSVEWIEQCELSLAENPSNPGAEMVVASMAKENTAEPVVGRLFTEKETEDMKKPFADYANFDDCVSKNSDKDDPKGYCAVIMRAVEGKKEDESMVKKEDEPKKDGAQVAMKEEEKPKDAPKKEEAKKESGGTFPTPEPGHAAETIKEGEGSKKEGEAKKEEEGEEGDESEEHESTEIQLMRQVLEGQNRIIELLSAAKPAQESMPKEAMAKAMAKEDGGVTSVVPRPESAGASDKSDNLGFQQVNQRGVPAKNAENGEPSAKEVALGKKSVKTTEVAKKMFSRN